MKRLILFLFCHLAFGVQLGEAKEVLKINLYATIVGPSTWEKQDIVEQINRANEIFDQCKIQFELKELTQQNWKYNDGKLWLDIDNTMDMIHYDDGAINFMMQYPSLKRPLLVFVEDWDYGSETNAVSAPMGRVGHLDNATMNTAWFRKDIVSEKYLSQVDPSYSVVAHELAHILGDMEHFLDPIDKNLMHYKFDLLNDKLTDKQCDHLRDEVYVGYFNKHSVPYKRMQEIQDLED